MPDYATKRVPLEPDESEPNNGDKSLEELRRLIIAPEQEDLARLHERIESPELRTQDVSEVLPEAMLLRRERGGDRARRGTSAVGGSGAARIGAQGSHNSGRCAFPGNGPSDPAVDSTDPSLTL